MISKKDIEQARSRISDIIHTTPLLHSSQLSALGRNDIYIKGEHLQKTGSFKIRGAANKVKEAVHAGAQSVTAASSGNHGQAVAYIANLLGVPATIVVPEDASACKIDAIKAYNGKVVKCGTTSAERLPKAKEIADMEGGVFIPPYDDPLIMAGQGTIGLEILEQLADVQAVVVPVGGGGLISGIATAIKETNPNIKVFGVEPELANDTYLSLKAGKVTSIPPTETIADGLRTSQPGDLTFPVLQQYLDDIVLVSEEEISRALYFTMERMKQLVEPSSAAAIAAALFHKTGMNGVRMAVIASGGNMDLASVSKLLRPAIESS